MSDTRVRDILTEIAARPAVQWQSLLAKQFPADPAMVQQALLWLHADHESLDDERDSLGEAGDERYELAVKLDSGASASVWQAFDRKLGRTVAIKILHARQGDALEQLIAEARAACDVISDHVVRILDVHDGERPYIVMELVGEHDPTRGELALGTAASSCEPRDLDEVASWVMRVARGVQDAHARNVFHRDLKPRNVLITPISRRARIADFGLAVSAASAANEAIGPSPTALVRSGPDGPVSISGTPEYMAPEQARGLPLDLDPRAVADRAVLVAIDVWGLGALAYALLAGRPPWGPRTTGADAWEKAASGTPPPVLDRTAAGERIPRPLRRIVGKAMAIDSAARYATAGQVAAELEAYLARKPTSFDRSRLARAWLWSRRNPQLALTALVAIALVVLVLGAHTTVARLRHERNALKDEVAAQHTELEQLDKRATQTRADLATTTQQLATTTQQLAAGNQELATLRKSIGDVRKLYETLLQTKDRALREATTATRRLVDELEAAKTAGRAADVRQAQSDAQLVTAQHDVERATKERDRARHDRDQARTERDALKQERDSAVTDRDDARKALEQLQQELARVSAALGAKLGTTTPPKS